MIASNGNMKCGDKKNGDEVYYLNNIIPLVFIGECPYSVDHCYCIMSPNHPLKGGLTSKDAIRYSYEELNDGKQN